MRFPAVFAALLVGACAQAPNEPEAPPASAPPSEGRRMSPAPAVTSVDLDNAADGTRVALKRGNELKVLLDAQLLAGLQWRYPANPGPVLSPIGERIFVSKGADPRNLSGGGLNVFRYRAERAGRVTLVFDYGGLDIATPATRSVRYHVTVE